MTGIEGSAAAYALAAAGGLAGSLHCLGMCGAFPLALDRANPSGPLAGRLGRQLLYQLGRVNALAFIGAVSGALGAVLIAETTFAVGARVLAAVAGGVMIALALEMLGAIRGLTGRIALAVNGSIARPLRGVMASPTLAAPVALGVLNAFLPCHLVYAFAAQAAASGSPAVGALTMLAFGAGTVPALFGLGLFGGALSPTLRTRLDRVVAVALVAYGIVLLWQAFAPAVSGHVH